MWVSIRNVTLEANWCINCTEQMYKFVGTLEFYKRNEVFEFCIRFFLGAVSTKVGQTGIFPSNIDAYGNASVIGTQVAVEWVG